MTPLQIAPITEYYLPNCYGLPMKGTPDGDGDSMLWAGLIHAVFVGDKSSIAAGIAKSQSLNGQIFRSPRRMETDKENSASRDMALGFLLYLASSNDDVARDLFLHLVTNHGRLCVNDTDHRCAITPPLWWAIKLATGTTQLPWYARWTAWLYQFYLFMAALTTPGGYQMHLVGVHSLLRLLKSKQHTLAAKILYWRRPLNPFFAALAGDIDTAEDLTRRYYQSFILTEVFAKEPMGEWLWERDYEAEEFDPGNSMLWDFVFMTHFIFRLRSGI